jgi:hypothetical protein
MQLQRELAAGHERGRADDGELTQPSAEAPITSDNVNDEYDAIDWRSQHAGQRG